MSLSKFKSGGTQVYDNGSKFLAMESIETSKIYSITINPKDQYELEENRFGRWSSNAYDTFSQMLGLSMRLFPEISPNGRLHFHGYLVVTNKIEFYQYSVHKLIKYAHVNMDTIGECTCQDDKHQKGCGTNWDSYVLKQVDDLKPLTKSNILYTKGYMDIKWPKKGILDLLRKS